MQFSEKDKTNSKRSWRTKAQLATPIGKWIEKMTYTSLGIYIVSVLLICAIYFWLASPYCNGVNVECISFLNSVYFSVITFSSLGYGDISPMGFGRVIASMEVLSGLTLLALFVGKVASEKQSAILLLLYTSEHQRRIQEFAKNLDTISNQIDNALTEHDSGNLIVHAKQGQRFLASIASYLSFQSNQGGLANFGNVSALRGLYRSIGGIQMNAINALKIEQTDIKARNSLRQINERAEGISSGMLPFHKNDLKTISYLNHLKKQNNDYKSWNSLLLEGAVSMNHRSIMTETILQKVKDALPPHPWPRNIQKEVATNLGLTNKFAQKCITELILRNTWPNFKSNKENK